jgi:hypothetical protein
MLQTYGINAQQVTQIGFIWAGNNQPTEQLSSQSLQLFEGAGHITTAMVHKPLTASTRGHYIDDSK